MAYDITLTNSNGIELLGSDGHFNIDKRLGIQNIKTDVQKYCKFYEKNFKWKFDHWTHFVYKNRQYPIY